VWHTLIGIVTVEQTMRLIIEARLADGDRGTGNDSDGVLAVVERRDYCLAQLGLTLAEGDSRSTVLRTVYGEVTVKSPRLWSCACQWIAGKPLHVVHPKALNGRVLTREGYEFSTLWWNLNTVSCYLRDNAHTFVNYGARHSKGLPI
jgi:hypothetical protein